MKKVVSVSLGSSDRNTVVELEVLGHPFRIERIGTDGNYKQALSLIQSLDGEVDAIGLGGIDRYLIAGERRYEIKQAKRMARAAQRTPIVNGSGLKHTLEPATLRFLQNEGIIDFREKRVLLMCGVDRFGMAEALSQFGCSVIYGDLIFALGIPIPIFSLSSLKILARLLLPILCWLPISWLYPTGSKQKKSKPKGRRFFDWAEIIAGDFHFIRRYMPERMPGKIIITNTVTLADIELLRSKGTKLLVTTTPDLEGRSFGTNVIEGILVALSGRRQPLSPLEYLEQLKVIGWKPRIERLN